MILNEIPNEIQNVLDKAASKYSESKSTTNAGFILRLVCKFISPSTVIKMFAHKLT